MEHIITNSKKTCGMKTFKLEIETLKNGKFNYFVIDETGNRKLVRTSNRKYVACTINGSFFFGRLDLIGKGDHGRRVKEQQSHGYETPIAYL